MYQIKNISALVNAMETEIQTPFYCEKLFNSIQMETEECRFLRELPKSVLFCRTIFDQK